MAGFVFQIWPFLLPPGTGGGRPILLTDGLEHFA